MLTLQPRLHLHFLQTPVNYPPPLSAYPHTTLYPPHVYLHPPIMYAPAVKPPFYHTRQHIFLIDVCDTQLVLAMTAHPTTIGDTQPLLTITDQPETVLLSKGKSAPFVHHGHFN